MESHRGLRKGQYNTPPPVYILFFSVFLSHTPTASFNPYEKWKRESYIFIKKRVMDIYSFIL